MALTSVVAVSSLVFVESFRRLQSGRLSLAILPAFWLGWVALCFAYKKAMKLAGHREQPLSEIWIVSILLAYVVGIVVGIVMLFWFLLVRPLIHHFI